MDASRKEEAGTPAIASLPAALSEITARAAAGHISGAIVLTVTPEQQVRVQILGSAGDDLHRCVGLLMDMATGALRR